MSRSRLYNFGFTASQYSDKRWSNLPLQCRIFLIGNTQKLLDHLRDHPMVGLFGSSYHVLALKRDNKTSSLYQRIQNKWYYKGLVIYLG